MEHDLQKGMMYQRQQGVRIMVLSATFNNISVIIVAVSFIGGGNRRKPWPAASHWQTYNRFLFYNNKYSSFYQNDIGYTKFTFMTIHKFSLLKIEKGGSPGLLLNSIYILNSSVSPVTVELYQKIWFNLCLTSLLYFSSHFTFISFQQYFKV